MDKPFYVTITDELLDSLIAEYQECFSILGRSGFQVLHALKELKRFRTPPKPEALTVEQLREMDEQRVWVQFPFVGMHALVSYLTDEDYQHNEDFEQVWLTNALGGRNSYYDVVSEGGVVYRKKPEVRG